MILKSMKHEYEVLQKLASSSEHGVYQCQYLKGDQKQQCLAVEVKKEICSSGVIDLFNKITVKNWWEDFIECFIRGDAMYVITAYHDYPVLFNEVQKGEYILWERICIFENICQAIIIQNIPPVILCDALKKEHLVINRHLDVFMQYSLMHIEKYYKYSMGDVINALFYWFKLLFKKELKYKTSVKLTEFYERLKNNKFRDIMEVYESCISFGDELRMLDRTKQLYLHNTLPYRIWEGIKKISSQLRFKVMAFLFLLLAAGSVLFYKVNKEVKDSPVSGLSYIGTVKIKGGDGE